jgi:predicted transcriptional regulator
MNVVFHNVAFPTLSPYTVKFAGWRIAKGSLDVESHYQIDGTKLAGKNKVLIRDMQLGEKMEVPGALDLPLDLLVSLLKDDEGKINIDIPITGDVSDPQFDFGAVVTQEVGDLLGNILASPFRALAGLFGGGEEALDHIDFPAGRADLEPPEKEKLQHVAELMRKKPKIDLVVAGVVDKQVDRRKLQHDAIDAAMAKELGDHATVSRQRRFLEAQFAQRVGQDKLAAVKQPFAQGGDDDPGYIAALRREVAKTEPVDDASLDKLAEARGKAVTDDLRQIPGFDAARVQVKGTQEAKSDDNYHVPMRLEAAEGGGK